MARIVLITSFLSLISLSSMAADKSEKIDGINEERNKLYLDFFDAVKACSPKFFLIENVSGMVTMDNGSFVKDIKKRFGKRSKSK
jgi:site-specific DNA-cytosine methylase